jgi:hypothetical protein
MLDWTQRSALQVQGRPRRLRRRQARSKAGQPLLHGAAQARVAIRRGKPRRPASSSSRATSYTRSGAVESGRRLRRSSSAGHDRSIQAADICPERLEGNSTPLENNPPDSRANPKAFSSIKQRGFPAVSSEMHPMNVTLANSMPAGAAYAAGGAIFLAFDQNTPVQISPNVPNSTPIVRNVIVT